MEFVITVLRWNIILVIFIVFSQCVSVFLAPLSEFIAKSVYNVLFTLDR